MSSKTTAGGKSIEALAKTVQKMQAKALAYEKQLHKLAPDSPEANQIRVPLCDALANLLLTDPRFASENNVVGRLWTTCFYSRICLMRKHVMKKQRRNQPSRDVQLSLTEFLGESLQLYNFLIQKLQERLVPPDATTQSPQSSQDESLQYHSSDGIVDCLCRLYVQLGDLYRYAESFEKAEVAYKRAAQFGPGLGHAMNQLAVLLSNRDPTGQRVVALYCYVRSLSVRPAPFETAKSNLLRLFDSNRTWLKEQNQLMADHQQSQCDTNCNSTNNNNKSLQSRLFLAEYCQIHEIFFNGLTVEGLIPIYDQFQNIRQALRRLLEVQGLSDGLLCKLVTIEAFAECFIGHANATDENRKEVALITSLVARIMTLQFGIEMAERIVSNMNRQNTSMRLLLPLMLVAEYVATRPFPLSEEVKLGMERTMHNQNTEEFWTGIVQVLNHLQPLADNYGLRPDEVGNTATLLTEYHSLRGFEPFATFLLPVGQNGVLSDEEAKNLIASFPTPKNTTATTEGASTKSKDQNRLKVARFLSMGRVWGGEAEAVPITWNGSNYELIIPSARNPGDSVDNHSPLISSTLADVAEKPIVPTLVYKHDDDGGPALLVPTVLMDHYRPYDNFDSMVCDSALPTERIVADVVATAGLGDDFVLETALDVDMEKPETRVLPPPGFIFPATNEIEEHHCHPPIVQPLIAPTQVIEPLYGLFGSMQTSNPFADPYVNSYGSSLVMHSPDPFVGGNSLLCRPGRVTHDIFPDDGVMDGKNLLDSGLLSSLWMEESKETTNNPFATS